MTHALSIAIYAGDDEVDRTAASLALLREDTRLRSVVAGVTPNDGSMPELEVIPCWSDTGAPAIDALVLRGGGIEERYRATAFESAARRRMVKVAAERGVDPTALAWRLEGHPSESEGANGRGNDRAIDCPEGRLTRHPYPLYIGRLAPLPGSPLHSVRVDETVQVAARRHLLDCRAVEVGALLLGSLCFDPELRRIEAHVTEYLPLEPSTETGASSGHFGFGVETFRKAKAAIARANEGGDASTRGTRVVLGWSHTHLPCASCFATSECRNDTIFFSDDDCNVQASAFSLPYQCATVFGKLGDRPAIEPGFRIYGWRRGEIAELPHG